MDMREPIGEFYRQPEDVLNRQALAGLFSGALDEIAEAPAGEVTSDHRGYLVIFPMVKDGRDVGMVTQPAQHVGCSYSPSVNGVM
jgi:hypothetical protein